ncbi:MAG: glycosyltransferase family 4 protein [Ktedonobacteraceae bacterium]
MKTIRVGFDLTANWRRQTGIFRYAAEVAKQLLLLEETEPHIRYVFFFAREIHPDFLPFKDSFDAVIAPTTNELLIKQCWYPAILPRLHLDAMHYPTFPPPYFHFFAPSTVLTLHDAGPWRYPQALTLHGRLYFRTLLAHGTRAYDRVITVSKHAKAEVSHFLGERYLAKISVIPEAARSEFAVPCSTAFKQQVRERFDLPDRYLFTVSTVEPRKNLVTLLDAYVQLKQQLSDASLPCPPLIIVGRKGWNCDDILSYMSELEGMVRFTGYVSDEELVALYQMASCLVFPSLYEGFGLPVLEAMMAGCPVITSKTSSLPEVAGDAGLLVDPGNAGEIATTIIQLLQDDALRASLQEQGQAWASRFSWAETAKMTRDVYITMANQRAKNKAV